MQENHTSVLGMRNVDNVTKNNIFVRSISLLEAIRTFEETRPNLNGNISSRHENNLEVKGNSLFVYSAQCNFSGLKYPLNWIQKAQDGILDEEKDKPSR